MSLLFHILRVFQLGNVIGLVVCFRVTNDDKTVLYQHIFCGLLVNVQNILIIGDLFQCPKAKFKCKCND